MRVHGSNSLGFQWLLSPYKQVTACHREASRVAMW